MSAKYFCDRCGEEISQLEKPEKRISLLVNGIKYTPDLCKKCARLIANIAYKGCGEFYHDDKK